MHMRAVKHTIRGGLCTHHAAWVNHTENRCRLRQNEERLRLGQLWEDQDLIFPNRVGKPINPSNLYHREYKPLLKRAGLESERFTFHSLRHTFASALCNKRVYPKVIQSLLGHSSITQTM